MLSSSSNIIGLTGQSNYAAGNAYMDRFARYRVAHGQRAVSLDLGPMVDDGILVDTAGFLDKVLAYGYSGHGKSWGCIVRDGGSYGGHEKSIPSPTMDFRVIGKKGYTNLSLNHQTACRVFLLFFN